MSLVKQNIGQTIISENAISTKEFIATQKEIGQLRPHFAVIKLHNACKLPL